METPSKMILSLKRTIFKVQIINPKTRIFKGTSKDSSYKYSNKTLLPLEHILKHMHPIS